MIPKGITRDSVLKALAKIDSVRYPKSEESRDYDVVHLGKRYPPKVVIRHAAFIQFRRELDEAGKDTFSGGIGPGGANQYLAALGFRIEDKKGSLVFEGAKRSLASIQPGEDEDAFPEGAAVYRLHLARERSAALVDAVKSERLEGTGVLRCDACGFDFSESYGEVGQGFIEAHHNIPISEMRAGSGTLKKDISLVCSNCHRMLHRSKPWISVEELKAIVGKHR